MLARLIHEPLAREIGQPLLTLPGSNNWFDLILILDWREIYMLPFGVPLDTKTRELQKRVSNKYLANNVLLYKIGITPPVCSFGEEVEETLAHLRVSYPYVSKLWDDVIIWLNSINIDVSLLSCEDIIFGIWKRIEDLASLNHFILISKPLYPYYCQVFKMPFSNKSLRVLISKVKSVIKTEKVIAKLNNKLNLHRNKWGRISLNWLLLSL